MAPGWLVGWLVGGWGADDRPTAVSSQDHKRQERESTDRVKVHPVAAERGAGAVVAGGERPQEGASLVQAGVGLAVDDEAEGPLLGGGRRGEGG